MAVEEADALYEELPPALRAVARALPLVCDGTPGEDLVRSGVAPETFGLFVGAPRSQTGDSPLPAQVLLFLENLWAYARGDERAYRDQVRRTLLHEWGHYLGLEEGDLEERGLA
jgi:predicted Zn-dependent protease with MMP-like domain